MEEARKGLYWVSVYTLGSEALWAICSFGNTRYSEHRQGNDALMTETLYITHELAGSMTPGLSPSTSFSRSNDQ